MNGTEVATSISQGTGIDASIGDIIILLSKYTESQALKEQTANVGKISTSTKSITVRWEAIEDVDGYEIRYSTSKSMKNSGTVDVKNAEAEKKKIGKLESDKTYYVQVRGYMQSTARTYVTLKRNTVFMYNYTRGCVLKKGLYMWGK